MKVLNFVEVATSGKNKMLKDAQLMEFLTNTLEVKKYLSIKEKRALIDDIISFCIIYDDGVYKFDEIDKYVIFTMKTISAYTNLELSADIEDDYDALCRANLLNVVIETFSGEYDNVNLLLQMKCDYILSGNTLEAQFGKFLTGIMDKIDGFASVLSSKFADFDINNLPVSKEDLSRLMEFVGSNMK